ncbi:hypothetical protein [Erwinia sp. V71]|uniref:hypothetical protein n=1 Tax=Erwinia sp. V71 TaxID=3369424 RepID=UPI003F6155BF
MKKTNDELIEGYKRKIQQVKERSKKETLQKLKKDKKAFDHQKYILAGSILKVLDLNINADAETVKDLLPCIIGYLESKKHYISQDRNRNRGNEILNDWSVEK